MTAKRYVARPVEIEAVQWTGDLDAVPDDWRASVHKDVNGLVVVDTLDGPARCMFGSYITRGTHGEFYPIRREIFEAKYEAVAP